MEVRRLENQHLDAAGDIAFEQWGRYDLPHAPEAARRMLYRYLARYYFHGDSPFSLGLFDETSTLQGMLLAHRKTDGGNAPEAWRARRVPPEYQALFDRYRAYLDGNREKELRHAQEGEAILALFASCRKGGGRLLMGEFERLCRRHGVPSMVLWTDDTCDFEYYYHNGYEEIAKMPTAPTLDGKALTTYLFRRKLQ